MTVEKKEPRNRLGSIQPMGDRHGCSFSGNPSTPGGPAHTVQRSLKPDAMAKMKCTLLEKFRNCARGQVIPETKERAEISKFKEKEEKWSEKQSSNPSVPLVWFAQRAFHSFTFLVCFFFCLCDR